MRAIEGSRAISILGFRDVKIGDVNAFLKRVKAGIFPATVQIVDARYVAGVSHLFFAFLNAQKAFEQNQMISENIEMETLLYASGNRQINKAIETLGVKSYTSSIATVIFASDKMKVVDAERKLMKLISGIRDDRVLEVNGSAKAESLRTIFRVTEAELKVMRSLGITMNEALIWLIVEKVALLTVNR